MSTSITCTSLAFSWPDGTPVFEGLDIAFGPGRTGLVGVNGSGKSTLLKLIAGELTPADGTVRVAGEVGYLPQNVTLDTGLKVDEALGIAAQRAALYAIEAGDVAEEHFETVGDDWDVEERALATLGELGLGHIELDRGIGEVSGGESVLLRLAALLLRRPDVLLLDEPTNNLDLYARRRLYTAVASWPGVMVVVSHDRELLDLVDQIADLRSGEVTWYGGNFSAYEEALAVEQDAAERDGAGRRVRLPQAETRTGRRPGQVGPAQAVRPEDVRAEARAEDRHGGAQAVGTGVRGQAPHHARGETRRGQGPARRGGGGRAGRRRDPRRPAVHGRAAGPYGADPHGPGTRVRRTSEGRPRPAGPRAGRADRAQRRGKTTLLRTIAGELEPVSGEATAHVPLRFLPQRLDVLDGELSVAENVARFAPGATNNRVRARLARFLFRGARADQQASTLSGGERFRAALAALMLAEPAPQLLMLDEPTNNLDMASVRQLTSALESYEGALVVASHDLPFLESIGITRWLMLDGELREVTPEALEFPA